MLLQRFLVCLAPLTIALFFKCTIDVTAITIEEQQEDRQADDEDRRYDEEQQEDEGQQQQRQQQAAKAEEQKEAEEQQEHEEQHGQQDQQQRQQAEEGRRAEEAAAQFRPHQQAEGFKKTIDREESQNKRIAAGEKLRNLKRETRIDNIRMNSGQAAAAAHLGESSGTEEICGIEEEGAIKDVCWNFTTW